MFEVGDRVVCVDDRPSTLSHGSVVVESYPTSLVRGHVYTIRAVLPAGSRSARGYIRHDTHVSVGVLNAHGEDSHNADRFRKLRDISQSLRELKELAINCPALVEP